MALSARYRCDTVFPLNMLTVGSAGTTDSGGVLFEGVGSVMSVQFASLECYFAEAKELVKNQIDEVKSANTKASLVVGFTGLLISNMGKASGFGWWAILLLAPPTLTIILCLVAYWSASLETQVHPAAIKAHYFNATEETTKEDMADELISCAGRNAKNLRLKHWFLNAGLVMFGVSAACLAVINMHK
jgi:hypothetical protein